MKVGILILVFALSAWHMALGVDQDLELNAALSGKWEKLTVTYKMDPGCVIPITKGVEFHTIKGKMTVVTADEIDGKLARSRPSVLRGVTREVLVLTLAAHYQKALAKDDVIERVARLPTEAAREKRWLKEFKRAGGRPIGGWAYYSISIQVEGGGPALSFNNNFGGYADAKAFVQWIDSVRP